MGLRTMLGLRKKPNSIAKKPVQGPRAAPTVFVLGTQRGGTTSLFRYMQAHPEIVVTESKEPHYFDLNFERGPRWYLDLFPSVSEAAGKCVAESSPYYLFHPLVPQRLKDFAPDAKLIVLLRDPSDRAISHYHHAVRKGHETLSLEQALNAEDERLLEGLGPKHRHFSYQARGHYADQLARWFALFERKNFLFLRSELFFARPAEQLADFCEFIGVAFHPLLAYPIHNKGGYDAVDPNIMQRLREQFYEPNKRLTGLLGSVFDFNATSETRDG